VVRGCHGGVRETLAVMPSPPDLLRNQFCLSRRALLGAAAGATLLRQDTMTSAWTSTQTTVARPETWRPWLLKTARELRMPAPAERNSSELAVLLALQARRTTLTSQTVERWGQGPAVLPWTDVALNLIRTHKPSPVRAARALALLHVAAYDAVVSVWDAKATYPRTPPQRVDPAIVPMVQADSDLSSFPSEHAAVAGAAAIVLAYLFPDASGGRLAKLADEAATSRLWAGVSYPSDIEAGFEIGRRVGVRAVAHGRADGSDARWDGSGRPTGPGFWQPTPPDFVPLPLDPLGGGWTPWVLVRGDQLRPMAPPAYQSPVWRAELVAVQEAVAHRTSEQEHAALFWAGGPGTVTPAGLWGEIARSLILRDDLDLPHAARVLALVSVAVADGFVCCWDAKYAYWTARPITADPSLDVLFPTPPFPSYTSAHSTISAAAATVLGHLFPTDEGDLLANAEEAKDSRLWAGIHFPIDNDMGATLGGMVGRLVVDYGRSDGAE
jgi:membrane-associated phospholipid phosphatase